MKALIGSLLISAVPPPPQSLPPKENSKKACVDFSGTWEGTCKVEIDSREEERIQYFAIEQFLCETIVIDKNYTHIPGVQSNTDTFGSVVHSSRIKTTWNPGKSILISTGVFSKENINEMTTQLGSSYSETRIVDGELTVSNIVEWATKGKNLEILKKETSKETCVLIRSQ